MMATMGFLTVLAMREADPRAVLVLAVLRAFI